jgi:hypothetical protein
VFSDRPTCDVTNQKSTHLVFPRVDRRQMFFELVAGVT